MGNANNSRCTEHSLPDSQFAAIASLTFYASLGALGLLGNINVILVFASSRERSLRFLVIVLSCMDLAICTVILPTDCYRVFADYLASSATADLPEDGSPAKPVNHWLSSLILSSRYAAFEMEAWILVLIAVDRYLCIVKARRGGLTLPRALVALGIAAAFLLLLESANIFGHYLIEDRCSLKLIVERQLLRLYGALGTASVLIVAVLYARIFTFVATLERRRSSRRAETERTLRTLARTVGVDGEGDTEAAESQTEPAQPSSSSDTASSWFPRKLALMLFAASVLFYFSMLPMVLINFKLVPDSPLHRFFYVNAALNCFVYALVNDKFRADLKQLYNRACCRLRRTVQ